MFYFDTENVNHPLHVITLKKYCILHVLLQYVNVNTDSFGYQIILKTMRETIFETCYDKQMKTKQIQCNFLVYVQRIFHKINTFIVDIS